MHNNPIAPGIINLLVYFDLGEKININQAKKANVFAMEKITAGVMRYCFIVLKSQIN